MNNSLPSPQQAARELLIRRKARENVLDYANAIEIPGKPAGEDPDTEFFKPIETTMAQHHRLRQPQLKPDRADVIVPALEIFTFCMKELKCRELYVPKIGLSDGMIYDMDRKGRR